MPTKWVEAKDLNHGEIFIDGMNEYYLEEITYDDSLEDEQGNVRDRFYVEARYFDGYSYSNDLYEFYYWPHEELEVYRR